MDSFESIVAYVLERQGYWVRTSVKVELTKAEKVKIGRRTCPRWELDVVGYMGGKNKLLVLECKSFLNSSGVCVETFMGNCPKDENRYKLFFDQNLRNTVLSRLETQLTESG